MTGRLTITAFLFSVWVLPTSGAAEPPVLPVAVEEHIRDLVNRRLHVGIAVGLVSPGGESYFSYGSTVLGNGHEIDEDTLFEIGSITKVFTSILLTDMAQQGAVGLDDPIAGYLPEGVRVPSRGREIRLLDLATHSSGLPRMPSNFAPADPRNPFVDYGTKQLYEFLSSHELRRDVGAEYEYSNFGAGLLGHLLAAKAGMTYEELVKRSITDEIGMKNTAVSLTPAMRRLLAQGYNMIGPTSKWDMAALAGAGALRSTARDMVAFLAANLGLKKSRLKVAMAMTHEPRRSAEGPHEVALGWHVRTDDGRRIVWHNGGTGGYWSFAGFVADRQLGVVVLTNTFRSVDELGFHLLDATLPLPELPKKKPLFSKS